jgi:hypothetical protein
VVGARFSSYGVAPNPRAAALGTVRAPMGWPNQWLIEALEGDETMNEDREIKNYEKLAERAKQVFENSKKKSGAWIDEALESAADQLEEAGEFTKQEGRHAMEFLRKDLEATRVDFDQAAKATKAALDPSRAGAGFADLASHLFDSLGDTFKTWAAKSEATLSFRTGQITGPGTLTCKACGTELHLDDPSRIPPCPKCHKTDYRKSF